LVSYKDVAMARGDAEYAKTISKDPFETVWDFLPLSDRYLGMTGMTPQEFLHVGGSGLYKHALIAVREIVGPNQSNSLVKGLVNKVFVDVKLALERNSERDISRMSNRKGFFNHASLTSEEVRGNFFAMVILMHTTYGRSLFKECFDKKRILFARLEPLVYYYWRGRDFTWIDRNERMLRHHSRPRSDSKRECISYFQENRRRRRIRLQVAADGKFPNFMSWCICQESC